MCIDKVKVEIVPFRLQEKWDNASYTEWIDWTFM